jgi:NAD(P)-dependent dehydrogenase (short-subunit alcohol dehydrogenase family)
VAVVIVGEPARLEGASFCAPAVVRGMMVRCWGRVINIASASGSAGLPGQANYAAAKADLSGLTRAQTIAIDGGLVT